jgi:hypothetical protein
VAPLSTLGALTASVTSPEGIVEMPFLQVGTAAHSACHASGAEVASVDAMRFGVSRLPDHPLLTTMHEAEEGRPGPPPSLTR